MRDYVMDLSRTLDLLEQNGFTPKGLNLPWKADAIAAGIKRQFAKLKASTLTDNPLNVLVVEVPGRFDHGLDRVDFALTFYYNAQAEALKLRSVRATMDGEYKRLYIVNNPEKMIKSLEMYKQLNDLRGIDALNVYMQINAIRSMTKSKTNHL